MKNTARVIKANLTEDQIKKLWSSGDYIYAAVRLPLLAVGAHHMLVDGREYPVARLSPSGVEGDKITYTFSHFVNRTESFPEPIKGFNY